MNQPTIPADVRERVIQAANDLYEQSGRQTLPTVDQVRRVSRVNMNSASEIMREWRRAQTAQAAPVAVTVPEPVARANAAALVTLWAQAQELANESLRAAQAAWEIERAELDAMRRELANAYEVQAGELDQVKAAAAAADQAHQDASTKAAGELWAVRTELAQAATRAERADATAGEIERRATDLRTELDRAHQDADQARIALTTATAERDQVHADLAKVKATAEAQAEAHQAQRKAAAQEAARQADRFTKAQAGRDDAQKAAAAARERAAELTGKLEAIAGQNAALLARLAPQGPKKR